MNEYKFLYTIDEQNKLDNDWVLNNQLEDYLFKNINNNYNEIEFLFYIYIKLCYLFKYDSKYIIDRTKSSSYIREEQENISVNNPYVICSNFSRFLTKTYNNYTSNINARSIIKNNSSHECINVNIKNKNINFMIDGTYTFGDFNDLTRAKIGIPFNDIKKLNNDYLKQLFYKVYSDLLYNDIIQSYNLLYLYHKKVNKIDFIENINLFLEVLSENNINDNELLCIFNHLSHKGYFEAFEYSFITCNFNGSLERNILMCYKDEYYLIRTNNYEFHKLSYNLVKELFDSNTIKYENDDYKLKKLI